MMKTINKSYYQSYFCDGYTAKVTIEWSYPLNLSENSQALKDAEEIADKIMSYSAPLIRPLVQKMRGYT